MLTLSPQECTDVIDVIDESGSSLPASFEELYHQLGAGDGTLDPGEAWGLLQVLDTLDMPDSLEEIYHQVATVAADPAVQQASPPARRWDLQVSQRTIDGPIVVSVDMAAIGLDPADIARQLDCRGADVTVAGDRVEVRTRSILRVGDVLEALSQATRR